MLLWVLADFQPKIQKIEAYSYNFCEVTLVLPFFFFFLNKSLFLWIHQSCLSIKFMDLCEVLSTAKSLVLIRVFKG